MTLPRVITERLGGGPLAQRVIAGDAPDAWYVARPSDAGAWRRRADAVRAEGHGDWLSRLAPAFGGDGVAATRLARVAAAGGVVVTTGQQPGLYGGPIYTWSKALSALELADAIERDTGVPTAPVFWAATDDADFAEAATTWVALPGGARQLRMAATPIEGRPMMEHPMGDLSAVWEQLTAAAGSAVAPEILATVERAYAPPHTVGSAYLALLREMLHPLGVSVLDASHDALLDAERPTIARALERAGSVAEALRARADELRSVGYVPQVTEVEGLSLVFRREDGRKARVPLSHTSAVAGRGGEERLSPNVLLRPVVERAVLPTVCYIAGPGEMAYFAQVEAVARTLGCPSPLVVPRWSCTILEPQVEALMELRGVRREEVERVDALEGRLAREQLSPAIALALAGWRDDIAHGASRLRSAVQEADGALSSAVLDGAERQMLWRVERVERRLVAALKRREVGMRRDVATIAGALRPGGVRQERALNLMPLLARHGTALLDAMRAGARRHAEALMAGKTPPDGAA